MKLTSRTLTVSLPKDLKASQLRGWVKDQLRLHGEPLRWAITSAHEQQAALQIEAVLIE